MKGQSAGQMKLGDRADGLMTRMIGFIILVPFDEADPSFAAYRKFYCVSPKQRQVISVDRHICDSFPTEWDYSIEEEYCLKFAGTMKIFKHTHNARRHLDAARRIDGKSRCVAVGADVDSGSQKILADYLLDDYGAEYKQELYREVSSPTPISWLGWDVADIEGTSLLSTTWTNQPYFCRNDWGLLDSFCYAEMLAAFGNGVWMKDGKTGHGPFAEWRLGNTVD